MDRYHVLEKLGCGQSSTVFKGQDRVTGKLVALKFMDKHQRSHCGCRREAIIHKKAHNHLNIVSVEDIIETDKEFIIIQEYVAGKDCATVLAEGALYEPFHVFTDIVEAVSHLHGVHIAHLDIKLENILLRDNSEIAVLADFGHASCTLEESCSLLKCACCEQIVEYETSGWMKPLKGTRAYLSPEALRCRDPDEFQQLDFKALDIWALGILLYVLLTSEFPWPEAKDDDECFAFKHFLESGESTGTEGLPREIVALLRGMLVPNPQYRFTIKDINKFIDQKCPTLGGRRVGVLCRQTKDTFLGFQKPAGFQRAQSLFSYIVIAVLASLLLICGQKCVPALPSMLVAIIGRFWKRLLLR